MRYPPTMQEFVKAHHILNLISEACLEIDSNSMIIFVNTRAEELFGKQKSRLIGRYIWEVFAEPMRTPGVEVINKAIKQKQSSQVEYFSTFFQANVSLRIIVAEHSVVLMIRKILNESNTILTSAKDISERQVAPVANKKNEQALEQLLKIKDEFMGIASHELKTPVASIKAYAQIVQTIFTEKGDDASAVYMEKINAQVDRLTYLINNLLDTTKLSEGQLPLHPEQFDINELIAEHVADMQYISENHRIVFTPGNVPLIKADRERIGQVLTNLVSNAIKYSPGGGDVAITSMLTKDGVRVSVHDSGIGIPKELKDKVFDRFFRVSDQRITSLPGMGLGLYITAGIIHRHGGIISVDSEVGKGSVFSFTLPLSPAINN